MTKKHQLIQNLTSDSPHNLESLTNDHLEDGWVVVGGIQANGDQYLQTIKKRVKPCVDPDMDPEYFGPPSKSIKIYHTLLDKNNDKMTADHCVVYSVLFDCMPVDIAYGRMFRCNHDEFRHLGWDSKYIDKILADLISQGHIGLHERFKYGDFNVSINHVIEHGYKKEWYIDSGKFREYKNKNDLLFKYYSRECLMWYKCINLTACKYWDTDYLYKMTDSRNIPRYYIGDHIYGIAPKSIRDLPVYNCKQEEYDKVESLGTTDVYHIVEHTNVSVIRILKILYKMGHIKPVPVDDNNE